MPLPPVLPRIPIGPPRATPALPGRAQQFSASQISQHKRSDSASTSIGRAIRERNAKNNQGPAVSAAGSARGPARTSIYHANSGTQSFDASDQAYAEAQDVVRDRLRAQHIRKLMKDKRAVEDAAKNLQQKLKGKN